MTKKIIVANWKMNPDSLASAKSIFNDLKKSLRPKKSKNKKEIVFCPPLPYFSIFQNLPKGVFLGAQDISLKDPGAFTGEVGAKLIKNSGAGFCIIGHSERRAMGETAEIVSQKIAKAINFKLTPIVCIGEESRDKDGQFFLVLRSMIDSSLQGVTKNNASKIIIAYEPIWAVGKESKGAIAPEVLLETSVFIRKTLCEMYGNKIGTKIPVIYGGSVDEKDAKEILEIAKVDGFIIGRASLNPKVFSKIISSL